MREILVMLPDSISSKVNKKDLIGLISGAQSERSGTEMTIEKITEIPSSMLGGNKIEKHNRSSSINLY